MESSELIKRITDLSSRCERTSSVTRSSFLTPAEQYELSSFSPVGDSVLYLFGGTEDSERKIAFFLPFYIDPAEFDAGEYIKAVKVKSYFGAPGHRDYLGAVLGLGIERDRIGDIIIIEDTAYVICLASVAQLLLNELDKVGRCGVKTEEIPLSALPAPEKKVKKKSFTVKSMRLDAVTGEMFSVSRTIAAEMIRQGFVSLNYSVCEKTDAPVAEGDIISVRGKGKGSITEIGGKSKKDRLFIEAEIYL